MSKLHETLGVKLAVVISLRLITIEINEVELLID